MAVDKAEIDDLTIAARCEECDFVVTFKDTDITVREAKEHCEDSGHRVLMLESRTWKLVKSGSEE